MKQHLKISQRYLGYSHEDIHKLLDSMPERHYQYRRITHGYSMLKLIERELGHKYALEALVHILADQKIIL